MSSTSSTGHSTSHSTTTFFSSSSTSHATTTTSLSSSHTTNTSAIAPTVSAVPGVGPNLICGVGMLAIPDVRPACAVPNTHGNSTAFYKMNSCCHGEAIVPYGAPTNKKDGDPDSCYLYCLAQHQTVGNLSNCLSHPQQPVLCNGNRTSEGNGTLWTPPALIPSASVSLTGSVTGMPTHTHSKAAAAPGVVTQPGVSKWGIGIMVMLALGSAAGMLL